MMAITFMGIAKAVAWECEECGARYHSHPLEFPPHLCDRCCDDREVSDEDIDPEDAR
jgi:hypothetical protein